MIEEGGENLTQHKALSTFSLLIPEIPVYRPISILKSDFATQDPEFKDGGEEMV